MITIRHIAEDGTLLVRENLVFALFAQAPLKTVGPAFAKAMQRWLEEVPRRDLSWATVGSTGTERKRVTPTTISRCLSALKPGAKPRGDLTYFMIQGPEDDNAAYRIEVLAPHKLNRAAGETSFIEFRFPGAYFDEKGADAVADFAAEIAADVPFDSGYMSPAASWSYESDLYLARKIIAPLALRHPGLDIHFNESTSHDIGRRVRGPYWITLAGPRALELLRGPAAVESALKPPATVRRVGEGILIRASTNPEIGDVNQNDKATALRAVARVLEPATFFGDTTIETYLFGNDEERFERWDRRLLE